MLLAEPMSTVSPSWVISQPLVALIGGYWLLGIKAAMVNNTLGI